ncbi:hypothetical protein ACGGZK_00390 [Agromyces sp. MMS24-K17]|uniref:hypothetical protein n=1 Tax=Agromyces sp. MMS24-K17 TaxID=3372850 RepID=UPI003754AE87
MPAGHEQYVTGVDRDTLSGRAAAGRVADRAPQNPGERVSVLREAVPAVVEAAGTGPGSRAGRPVRHIAAVEAVAA